MKNLKEKGSKMKILKEIKDIKFRDNGVSEPIVMSSQAGWYIGAVDNSDGFIQPYDRYTAYMEKQEAIDFLPWFLKEVS